jgi:MoxR-like ATPase
MLVAVDSYIIDLAKLALFCKKPILIGSPPGAGKSLDGRKLTGFQS